MNSIRKINKVIKALAGENRLRIAAILSTGKSLCVCEITAIIGLSQPTISSHLKKMEEAGLVLHFKDGLWVNYRLNNDMPPEVKVILGDVLEILSGDEDIKRDMDKTSKICREEICKKKV